MKGLHGICTFTTTVGHLVAFGDQTRGSRRSLRLVVRSPIGTLAIGKDTARVGGKRTNGEQEKAVLPHHDLHFLVSIFLCVDLLPQKIQRASMGRWVQPEYPGVI